MHRAYVDDCILRFAVSLRSRETKRLQPTDGNNPYFVALSPFLKGTRKHCPHCVCVTSLSLADFKTEDGKTVIYTVKFDCNCEKVVSEMLNPCALVKHCLDCPG